VTQSRASLLREHDLDPDAPTVALLPGSRPNELHRIVPDMAAALPLIRASVPRVQFLIAAAPNLADHLFAPLLGTSLDNDTSRPVLIRERSDDVLAASDVVITASGTATVQAALHERPMVVVYRLSPLTYWIGKPFVLVDTYAMANLIAGRRVVPELIQDALTPTRVAEETVRLLTNREEYEKTRAGLRIVRERLGAPGASGRAAAAVLAVAHRELR